MMIQQSKQQHQENARLHHSFNNQPTQGIKEHHPAQASNGKQHKASAAVMKG